MAKMYGCNEIHNKQLFKQGKNTITPGTFARNSLSKGGVNKDLSGVAKSGSGGSVNKGGASQGKYKNMPKRNG